MYVDLELAWDQHPFMFSNFLIKTEKDIAMIQQLGLKSVTVLPDRSRVVIPASSTPSIKNKSSAVPQVDYFSKKEKEDSAAEYIVHRDRVARLYQEQAKKIKDITRNIKAQSMKALADLDDVVNALARNFSDSENIMTSLVNLGGDEYTDQSHALNVTVLSLMLGHAEGISQQEMKYLGMGALLHDIGKVALPKIFSLTSHVLTPDEEKLYISHTRLGRDLVQSIKGIPDDVVNIIYQHHEYLDGTGYPQGSVHTEINELVRIISVANVYDNLCNPHDINHAMTPQTAMATMFSNYKDKLDRHLVERYIKILGVYPPGTVVKLNNSEIGVVITVNSEASMQPKLLMYQPDDSSPEPYILNLLNNDKLTISHAMKPSEYPEGLLVTLGIRERIGYMFENKSA